MSVNDVVNLLVIYSSGQPELRRKKGRRKTMAANGDTHSYAQ